MKNVLKKAAAFALALSLGLTILPAMAGTQAMAAESSDENSMTFQEDMTGDGAADTIVATAAEKDDNDYIRKIKISVNGEPALTMKTGYAYNVEFNYIHLSNKREYLQVVAISDNGIDVKNVIFYYNKSTKKLKTAVNLLKVLGAESAEFTKVSSGKILVTAYYQPAQTGYIKVKFKYTPKGNKLVRTSKTGTVSSMIGKSLFGKKKYTKLFKKNIFVAKRNLKFVTKVGGKKVKFTASKKDRLKLTKAWVKNGKLWLKFKKGKKSGWIKIPKNYKHDWFYDVSSRLVA